MGTHLSMTARHLAVALTLAVSAAGAVALPAWVGLPREVARATPTGARLSWYEGRDRHRRTRLAVSTKVGTGTAVPGRTTSTKVGTGTVRLGPAVKYVRHKDGSIHRVR